MASPERKHIFSLDISTLRQGTVYESYCGRIFVVGSKRSRVTDKSAQCKQCELVYLRFQKKAEKYNEQF